MEYKFVVVSGDNCIWEDGCNRELELDERTYCDISLNFSILSSGILELLIE